MKHTVESHMVSCGCRSVGECHHNDFAELKALDALVDDFADAMKKKLLKKMMDDKAGWDDPQWPRANILQQLRLHVDRGDMVDVANFAAFAWNQEAGEGEK